MQVKECGGVHEALALPELWEEAIQGPEHQELFYFIYFAVPCGEQM